MNLTLSMPSGTEQDSPSAAIWADLYENVSGQSSPQESPAHSGCESPPQADSADMKIMKIADRKTLHLFILLSPYSDCFVRGITNSTGKVPPSSHEHSREYIAE